MVILQCRDQFFPFDLLTYNFVVVIVVVFVVVVVISVAAIIVVIALIAVCLNFCGLHTDCNIKKILMEFVEKRHMSTLQDNSNNNNESSSVTLSLLWKDIITDGYCFCSFSSFLLLVLVGIHRRGGQQTKISIFLLFFFFNGKHGLIFFSSSSFYILKDGTTFCVFWLFILTYMNTAFNSVRWSEEQNKKKKKRCYFCSCVIIVVPHITL